MDIFGIKVIRRPSFAGGANQIYRRSEQFQCKRSASQSRHAVKFGLTSPPRQRWGTVSSAAGSSPLVEPDVRISRIRLSSKLSPQVCALPDRRISPNAVRCSNQVTPGGGW